jgi:biotin operon repressor/anti-sigma regulatory factor (Ser/Thr protein kinase)
MKRQTAEVRDFILEKIQRGQTDINPAVTEKFGISRQAVSKNIRALVDDGLVVAEGTTRNRTYKIKWLANIQTSIAINPKTEEDQVWKQIIAPHLQDVKENVREICHFGFTEMLNNVIDHSGSDSAEITIMKSAIALRIHIHDRGIGIWKNLQSKCNLTDPRHALLELSKGKLTTDPKKHTGEGIFFTSRMFDTFVLESDTLSFCRFQEGDEWLFEVKEHKAVPGTHVVLTIRLNSTRTTKEVFDKFASEYEDFGFTRTHVSIALAKYEGDHLVSRSQAKRILARLEQFKEVYLDFDGITEIGQAFADEIFRVFQAEHPEIHLWPVNATPEVEKMVRRAMRLTPEEPQPELPLG